MRILILFILLGSAAWSQNALHFGTRPADFDEVQRPTERPVELLEPLEVIYPDSALRQGWEGVCIVAAWIDRSGYPVYAEVRQSSGHAMLDSLALRSVERGNFKAAQRGGRPVGSRVTIPIEYRLRRGEAEFDAAKDEEQLRQEAEELRRARQMLEDEQRRLEEEIRRLREQQKSDTLR